MKPRLLVSVRSLAEAQAAVTGGCDLLDLKEPSRGSLGCPDLSVIEQVRDWLRTLPTPQRPALSIALGDVCDWQSTPPLSRILAGVQFIKLGTRTRSDTRSTTRGETVADSEIGSGRSVPNSLSGLTAEMPTPAVVTLTEYAGTWDRIFVRCDRDQPPVGIAVAYADAASCHAPDPVTVGEWAAAIGLSGWLIDTADKASGRLCELLSRDELQAILSAVRENDLTIGLAGRIQQEDLPAILPLSADVIGIRSAACRDGLRQSEIDPERVRLFKQALRAVPR